MSEQKTSRDNQRDILFPRHPPTTLDDYLHLQQDSILHREAYWKQQAERMVWATPPTVIVEEDWANATCRWFADGRLNACVNAIDRWIDEDKGDQVALVVLGRGSIEKRWTFAKLRTEVDRVAAAMVHDGLTAGDRVVIWAEMRWQAIVTILACARAGLTYVLLPTAIPLHYVSVLVHDCDASMVITDQPSAQTPTEPERDGKTDETQNLKTLIERQGKRIPVIEINDGTEPNPFTQWVERTAKEQGRIEPVIVPSEHPLMLLYPRVTAGLPRANVFATGGFITQTATSYDHLFGQVLASVAEPGVVSTIERTSMAEQSYGIWGPLLNGHHIVLLAQRANITLGDLLADTEGQRSNHVLITTPDHLLRWRNEQRQINAVHDRASSEPSRQQPAANPPSNGASGQGSETNPREDFAVVAATSKPLTPRTAAFTEQSLVDAPHRLVNLWTQSESACALITAYPTADLNRPGLLGLPALGVDMAVVDDFGQLSKTNEGGHLMLRRSWPGMVRGIWNQPGRLFDLYFRRNPGFFATNDGVRVDKDGFVWFMRRLDDVVKINGQSLSTSEVEGALLSHPFVDEAAVVGSHEEGQDTIIAFIVPSDESTEDAKSRKEAIKDLKAWLAETMGDCFVPSRIVPMTALPRTRTGKVIRRLLKRIAVGDASPSEDLSHVANPEAITSLFNDDTH
ncbi:MAG: AMP-binding protein [Deltaproteobacteria bacterium]|nr:AMP-binding protein [Deltaproteobacteria bacterium]